MKYGFQLILTLLAQLILWRGRLGFEIHFGDEDTLSLEEEAGVPNTPDQKREHPDGRSHYFLLPPSASGC
jgi:hypothetical protein